MASPKQKIKTMSLETLEQKLNQIDADTVAKLANDAPTTIDVEVVPTKSVSEMVTTIKTKIVPSDPNPEKDGTPIVAAETLVPNNETVIDVEATVISSEPVTETTVAETQTPVVGNQRFSGDDRSSVLFRVGVRGNNFRFNGRNHFGNRFRRNHFNVDSGRSIICQLRDSIGVDLIQLLFKSFE
jgi:hypothetical protein